MKHETFKEWCDGMQYVRTADKFYGPGGSLYSEQEIRKQYDHYCNTPLKRFKK